MEKNYLIVNIGSSSKRYGLFTGEREVHAAYIEKSGSKTAFMHSTRNFLTNLITRHYIQRMDDIAAVGFRVVAPGTYFTQHKKITAGYLKKLTAAAAIAPLHIEAVLDEIKKWRKFLPHCPFYAISDSAFHATMPDIARVYALPKQVAKKYDIYRFGYHGISVSSIVRKVHTQNALINTMVVCHLSGGSSITAIKDGISIDTSMGFTPLEGVPMVSRIGTIDPGALIYLMQEGLTAVQLKKLLFNKCGMIGLTNHTDMRQIVALAQKGDQMCMKALELFAYQVKKYIGAYKAVLGTIDLLVFTGGIGEGSPFVRALVCKNLVSLGIIVHEQKNNAVENCDDFVHHPTSATKIAVLKTEEMHEMIRELQQLI